MSRPENITNKKMLSKSNSNSAAPKKKRTITMACGHRVSVPHGETKEESDKIASSRKKRLLCDKCCSKHETNFKEATAIIGCRHARCAELTGTENQINWAEIIRFAHLRALDAYSELVEEDLKHDVSKLKTALSAIGETRKWIKNISEAKWWIENHAESFKSVVGYNFGLILHNPVKIIRMAVNILITSPSMNAARATALDLEDRWYEFDKDKANAEAEAKALAAAIIADKQLEHDLIARARSLKWCGVVKPWRDANAKKLFFNDMGNCSICWWNDNFEGTVKFWGMDDSSEFRQLAKEVWQWCVNPPNSNKSRCLQI